ncbi:MAG: phosphoglycerate kinase [Elusimicrobia bacterium]|nr:phosphoglycerate kinase [Elusimicrobiota bacterium]
MADSQQTLKLRRLQDMNLRGARVLARVDYNVPLKDGGVADDTRIRETLPTLRHLLDVGAKVTLVAHLGRPSGKPNPKYSLKPVAERLGQLLKTRVHFASDCVGPEAHTVSAQLGSGELALLENLRFHPEEESNGGGFAQELSRHGEFFVQDAFGALHRAHASTAGVPKYLPGCIGLLVQKELEFLDRVIGNPQRPFLAILGGAKVSDKIGVMRRLVERIDTLVVGGGMAYTFLAAQNVEIGKSLLEKASIPDAKSIIEKAYNRGVECLLPADHVTVGELKDDCAAKITSGMAISPDQIGADIGPRSIEIFSQVISDSKTIFWNGPMGVFEMEPFARGSVAVAKAVARATGKGAVSIVGGGDSLALLNKAKVADKVTHCSTGGGASLEFLEGRVLPGLLALSQ